MLRRRTTQMLARVAVAALVPSWSIAQAQHKSLPLTQQDRDRIAQFRAKTKSSGDGQTSRDPLPPGFVSASSNQGLQLAATASHTNSAVESSFLSQSEMFSCAIATLGILLSRSEFEAFELMCRSLPDMQIQTAKHDVIPNVLEPCFNPRLSALWVPGVMDITNFAICATNGKVHATKRFGYGSTPFGEEDTLEDTSNRFRAALQTLANGSSVAISFDRKVAGQTGGGHWSPVAAYHAQSDMVLVLDTAPRYGAYWAPVSVMCQAMRTRNMYGHSRGWVVIASGTSNKL